MHTVIVYSGTKTPATFPWQLLTQCVSSNLSLTAINTKVTCVSPATFPWQLLTQRLHVSPATFPWQLLTQRLHVCPDSFLWPSNVQLYSSSLMNLAYPYEFSKTIISFFFSCVRKIFRVLFGLWTYGTYTIYGHARQYEVSRSTHHWGLASLANKINRQSPRPILNTIK